MSIPKQILYYPLIKTRQLSGLFASWLRRLPVSVAAGYASFRLLATTQKSSLICSAFYQGLVLEALLGKEDDHVEIAAQGDRVEIAAQGDQIVISKIPPFNTTP